MANQAVKTQGTVLAIEEPPGSTTYVDIGDVKSVGASGGQAPEIDVTNLGSTAKEFILGLADNGTIPLGLNWAGVGNDAGQTHLLSRYNDSTATSFRVTFSNSDTMTFSALVQTFDVSVEPDAAVDLAVGLRVTGSRVFA